MKDMKIIRSILKSAALLGLAALCCSGAAAQETRLSPAAREFMLKNRFWFNHTNNAAGSRLDNTAYYSQFDAGFSYGKGDFTRPQAGTSSRDITFSTEGGGDVGGFYAWGSFDYVNNYTKGTLFNSSSFDPLRGNPYIIADYRPGDWYKQLFSLRMNVATPKFWNDRVALGLDIGYTSNTGAKQVDPRPKVDLYEIVIKPGIVYSVDDDNSLGLSLEYSNLREESDISNNNITITWEVAFMRGFGYFSSIYFPGDKRYCRQNGLGAELQYAYRCDDNIKLILAGGLKKQTEYTEDNPHYPIPRGSLNTMKYWAGASAVFGGARAAHFLNVSYGRVSTDGIEEVYQNQATENGASINRIIDKNVRSNYKTTAITGSYDFFRTAAGEYSWKAGANVSYLKTDDIYYVPRSTQAVSSLDMGISGGYNFLRGSAWRLLAEGRFGYNKTLDSKLALDVPTPGHAIVTDLVTPDFAYLATDYYRGGIWLTVSREFGKNTGNIYLKAGYEILKPSTTESTKFSASDSRNIISVKAGCLF